MNREELYWSFRNLGDRMKAMEARGEAFHNKLSQELFDLVFSYWPEMERYREQLTDPMRELAEEFSNEAMECLNVAEYYLRTGEPVKDVNPIPKPITEEDAEVQVQKYAHEFPTISHEEWRSMVWEDFEVEMRGNHFIHRIHQLMKQVLTEFYLEDILKLEPDHLLMLDDYLYIMGACRFSQGFYELEDKVEREKKSI